MQRFKTLIFILLIGCSSAEEEINPSIIGWQFFPLETGDYRVYQVNAVRHFFNTTPDTVSYQLIEKTAGEFEDLSGGISYRIERSKRDNENAEWEIDSVWTARRDVYTATQVEHNVPIIKLSFPLKENKKWNANSLNDKAIDEYFLKNVNVPFKINDTSIFQNTSTVIQDSVSDNILFRNLKKEIYSENIGLIYKEVTLLEFCAEVECVGQDIIESGLEYKQWMIAYGKE